MDFKCIKCGNVNTTGSLQMQHKTDKSDTRKIYLLILKHKRL
jgi:hypothetical protein